MPESGHSDQDRRELPGRVEESLDIGEQWNIMTSWLITSMT